MLFCEVIDSLKLKPVIYSFANLIHHFNLECVQRAREILALSRKNIHLY